MQRVEFLTWQIQATAMVLDHRVVQVVDVHTAHYADNADLGRRVLECRRNGDPWKVICRRFGRCRTQLWKLAKRAAGEPG